MGHNRPGDPAAPLPALVRLAHDLGGTAPAHYVYRSALNLEPVTSKGPATSPGGGGLCWDGSPPAGVGGPGLLGSVVDLDNLASARIDKNRPVVDHDIAVFDVGNFVKLDGIWQR